MTLNDLVSIALFKLKVSSGVELYVPKIPFCKVVGIAEAISAYCEEVIIGFSPGEKSDEECLLNSHCGLN